MARAASAEPDSRSIREALARAQFDAGSYAAALENFRTVALADPSDDYAQFGWGVAAARLGDFEASAEHLALAVAMRPENDHYRAALRQTRATLTARAGGSVRCCRGRRVTWSRRPGRTGRVRESGRGREPRRVRSRPVIGTGRTVEPVRCPTGAVPAAARTPDGRVRLT